jgi:hypothetical protein
MAHTCHAEGCSTKVPPKLLMCARHWRLVPKDLQSRVWATYRPGQEVDKRPTAEYLAAAQAAIDAVAELELGQAGKGLKALTVWQPWASLIIGGAKPWEFRGWPAPNALVGRRIVIHAGARPVKRAEIQDLLLRMDNPDDAWTTALDPAKARPLLEHALVSPGSLPLAAGLGTALLGRPTPAAETVPADWRDSDRVDHHQWAWPLTDIEPWEPVRPMRGAQGFWFWPETIHG